MTLLFSDRKLPDWQKVESLNELDQAFLNTVAEHNPTLHQDLLAYRQGKFDNNPLQISEIIINTAKLLEPFLAAFFAIETAVDQAQLAILQTQPIFVFKKWFIQRRAKRRLGRDEVLPSFITLDNWLTQQLNDIACFHQDKELAIGEYAVTLLQDETKYAEQIELLTQWCVQALSTPEGQAATKGWSSFKLPERRDYQRLIPLVVASNDALARETLAPENWRQRDGFDLTDPRMTEREALSEVDYCIYCHDHDGDFCSKGFPEKKGEPELGFRKNPLGNLLTDCPLDEKISEMNILKRDGYNLAALATVMIDNPMCPATGHRICNDCMKACIYQKQDPVNIPQIETCVLMDVLALPYGVEIYDLLTRWNPLRQTQWLAKPYNGLKVFIAGMGPAGFTMAHHLLMEGFAVVGTDGLKIEPLPRHLLEEPIKDFNTIKESLSARLMLGFGGVAEYGITVRWDKNFLKLIYLTLSRRPQLQIFGGVRFGGTVTVEDLWQLGFNHAVIAVGAGLPKALPIPNSMARGMRQANDFLMALQLTGAAKPNSLANLQLRMPVVVIGGGLTGVDTATEAQAYYITQVEKTLHRYEALCQEQTEQQVRAQFDKESLSILDEFVAHGKIIRAERKRAAAANETPHFLPFIQAWGGVTITYRRTIEESPAYISNHEELAKALEEGIFYLENIEPLTVLLDEYQHSVALVCKKNLAEGQAEEITLPAKSILVATGARPNIAYDFEHAGTFKRNGQPYQNYEDVDNELHPAEVTDNLKASNFGPFTSYTDEHDHRVSFIGDTHPLFHGNVVRAIASAMRTYPKIVKLFDEAVNQLTDENEYQAFAKAMHHQFHTHIKSVTRRAHNVVELEIHAPMATARYQPGQFFRLQNFESTAYHTADVILQTEPLALYGFDANKETGAIKVMVLESGSSSKICATFQPQQAISFMGPTGVRSKLPEDHQHILVIGGQLSLGYIRALGKALRAKGNHVTYIGCFTTQQDLFCQEEVEAATDKIIWATEDGSRINPQRQQDEFIHGETMDAFLHFAKQASDSLDKIDRITIISDVTVLQQFQALRHSQLQHKFKPGVKVFASIYSTMQCMLKGVCAQCLQWQIDPETGLRTKAVFSCSWQDQPLDLVEIDNLAERLGQNRTAEILSNLWLERIFHQDNIERC